MVDVKNNVIEACLREKENGCESGKMYWGRGERKVMIYLMQVVKSDCIARFIK
jgi:hypothetical protein